MRTLSQISRTLHLHIACGLRPSGRRFDLPSCPAPFKEDNVFQRLPVDSGWVGSPGHPRGPEMQPVGGLTDGRLPNAMAGRAVADVSPVY
jgi:hypothetical protein